MTKTARHDRVRSVQRLGLFALATVCATSNALHADETTPAATQNRAVLEEVLVTARKRSESMQDIPIAVTAISAESLRERGISNTSELTKSVPSLEIRKGQANQIYIRGIGERTGFARVDPTVGVYLDDLFLPRSDGQLLDTVDIDSIQVLRGPQGTLFGKNTTGGAMVVSLRKPDDSNDAYVEVGVGNYAQRRLKAGVNVPINDHFYASAAINITKDEYLMSPWNSYVFAVFESKIL